jgi:hypothetical protein
MSLDTSEAVCGLDKHESVFIRWKGDEDESQIIKNDFSLARILHNCLRFYLTCSKIIKSEILSRVG